MLLRAMGGFWTIVPGAVASLWPWQRAAGSKIFAHDVISAARMAEIGPRAARGGHDIEVIPPQGFGKSDENLTRWFAICPVRAAGPGAARRKANGALRETTFRPIVLLQRDIIAKAITYLAPDARLALITCSIFRGRKPRAAAILSATPSLN